MSERPEVTRNRLSYVAALAIITPLGFATKLYVGPGAHWVSTSAGGFFYVLFWVFAYLSLVPDSSPNKVTLWVFGITCALESLQLWHPPFLERLRSTFLGQAVLGSTFSWWDFVYYGLAAASAPVIARLVKT
jgi:Protein of unknown function (DUF2809)